MVFVGPRIAVEGGADSRVHLGTIQGPDQQILSALRIGELTPDPAGQNKGPTWSPDNDHRRVECMAHHPKGVINSSVCPLLCFDCQFNQGKLTGRYPVELERITYFRE